MANICPRCRRSNHAEARFCGSCGMPLFAPIARDEPRPVLPAPPPPPPPPPPEGKKEGGGCGCLIIILVIVGIGYCSRESKKPAVKPPQTPQFQFDGTGPTPIGPR